VNSKLGDGGQPQHARQEKRNKNEEHERWVALHMVNASDNGSFKFSYVFTNSIL
jgi:hypothetical protein